MLTIDIFSPYLFSLIEGFLALVTDLEQVLNHSSGKLRLKVTLFSGTRFNIYKYVSASLASLSLNQIPESLLARVTTVSTIYILSSKTLHSSFLPLTKPSLNVFLFILSTKPLYSTCTRPHDTSFIHAFIALTLSSRHTACFSQITHFHSK